MAARAGRRGFVECLDHAADAASLDQPLAKKIATIRYIENQVTVIPSKRVTVTFFV